MDGEEGGGRGGRVVHIDGIVRDDGRKWKKKIRLARQSTFLSFLSLFFFIFFFCQGDTRFFVAIHSPQIDRGRNFEKWEFWMDVECNGNNAFLFPFFPSFLPSNWKICDSMGYWGMMALNRITIFFFFEREIGDWK